MLCLVTTPAHSDVVTTEDGGEAKEETSGEGGETSDAE